MLAGTTLYQAAKLYRNNNKLVPATGVHLGNSENFLWSAIRCDHALSSAAFRFLGDFLTDADAKKACQDDCELDGTKNAAL